MKSPPHLAALAERFDPDVFDEPPGGARVRLAVREGDAWDVAIRGRNVALSPADAARPDALIVADERTWQRVADDVRGGMDAYRRGRLRVRRNLHLGVAFLTATSGITGPGRPRFRSVATRLGRISLIEAGAGDPVVALHGLGGTKISFLPTVSALADRHRILALDLPGFGESAKPIAAPYDARWFARAVTALLDALDIEQAHVIGNSMGGRIAIETGLRHPERVRRLALLSPALAWLRERRWASLLRLVRPELGLIQPAPRPIVERIVRSVVPGAADDTWVAAGVDEFLRSYLTPRGRAAFYAAARNIYLDEPHGDDGFWTRLAGLSPDVLFVWGRSDQLVPVAFRRHVQRALPAARHVELDCGHVPQVEAPERTHDAIRRFFAEDG